MRTQSFFQRSRFLQLSLFALVALLSTACAQRGLSAFSPDSSQFAVITEDGRLVVTDPLGFNQTEISSDASLRPGFGVSFSPDGNQVAYVTNEGGLCTTELADGARRCVSMPPNINSGLVSYAPNGNVIFVLVNGDQWIVQSFTPTGALVNDQSYSGIDMAFFPQALIKSDNISGANSWRVRSNSVSQPTFVFIRSGQAGRYQLTDDGLIDLGVTELTLSQDMLAAVLDRDLTKINAGILSPDGNYIAWTTTDARLLLLDLSDPEGTLRQLATGAIDNFAFSPDSLSITWSDATGVWIADGNGDNATLANAGGKLAGWAP